MIRLIIAFSTYTVTSSCEQYSGDHFIYFVNRHLELSQNSTWTATCDRALEYLPLWTDLKVELVCDTLVDSILDQLPISEEQKAWVRYFYDFPGVGIDRNSTKFSDICGCSCLA